MKNNKWIVLMAAVPMLFFASCNKQAKTESARVKFNLTDAPAQCDALNIDISSIQVHTEANGWVTLQSSLGVINVMEYVNGETTVIAEGEIAAGNIDEVRLVLGTANTVVVNGTTYALQNVDEVQQGLNIALNTNLAANGNYEWTIDFDAAQSVQASASGAYNFNPTIRLLVNQPLLPTVNGGSISVDDHGGTTSDITIIESGSATASDSGSSQGSVVVNGATSGNITGSISSVIGVASVCCTCSNGSNVCTMTDLSGHFTIQAVSTGTCTITIDPVMPLLSTHTVSNISVAAGATTNVGVIAF